MSRLDKKEGALTSRMQRFIDHDVFSTGFVAKVKRGNSVSFDGIDIRNRGTISLRNELRENARKYYDYLLKRTYLNCWHINRVENHLMWASYLDKRPGVAVRTTVERLLKCFETVDDQMFLIPVEYVDHGSAPLNENRISGGMFHILCDMLSKKRQMFAGDQELRLVVDTMSQEEKWGRSFGGRSFSRDGVTGTRLDLAGINPLEFVKFESIIEVLVAAIILDPKADDHFKDAIFGVLRTLKQNGVDLFDRVKTSDW